MATPAKKPRRTAQRILEVSLDLFNRFGEPNVSTTLISAELNISPGNLYYHYPSKDELINSLFDRYEAALTEMLRPADNVSDVRNAWFFFHTLFEVIWHYRFLYRDLNDLLSKNRRLETHFQRVLADKTRVVRTVLEGMERAGSMRVPSGDASTVVTGMVVVLTYWLSFEYVRDPRRALEPDSANAALLRGAFHVLSLLAPYLTDAQREQLTELMHSARRPEAAAPPRAYDSMFASLPGALSHSDGALMSDLKTRFDRAVVQSRELPEKPDNLTLLKLYALFKQGSLGDVQGERPGLPDFVGGAKWDAWERLRGTSSEVAMARYSDLVDTLK